VGRYLFARWAAKQNRSKSRPSFSERRVRFKKLVLQPVPLKHLWPLCRSPASSGAPLFRQPRPQAPEVGWQKW
jgi:hypothetical protein